MTRVFTVVAALVAVVSALLVFGISVPLDFLRAHVESGVGALLDRQVTVRGPLRLNTSLHPSLEFGGLTVANPAGWPGGGDVLAVDAVSAQISIGSLFHGEIQLDHLKLEGMAINLVTRAKHESNYRLPARAEGPSEPGGFALTGVSKVSLHDIAISYVDELSGVEYLLTVDKASGHARPGLPLHFAIEGELAGQPYLLEIVGDPLTELLQTGGLGP